MQTRIAEVNMKIEELKEFPVDHADSFIQPQNMNWFVDQMNKSYNYSSFQFTNFIIFFNEMYKDKFRPVLVYNHLCNEKFLRIRKYNRGN